MAELGVFGVGVATADPELRNVGAKNTAVCTVNLAFNRSFLDKDGNWQNEVCFLRTQVWGGRAERMAELVKKGQPIYVSGYMKQDSWTTDDGQKRVAHSLNLRDFQLCVKTPKNDKNTQEENTNKPVAVTSNTSSDADNNDIEIPF